jgi:predicted nucleotidyltransferase
MFENYIQDLSELPEIEAIALGGSRATGTHDEKSDYDVYLYCTAIPDIKTRKELASKYCSSMEINNTFWETEDDGTLKNGIDIEFIFRSLNWLESELENLLVHFHASTGYSSCLWFNLLNSKILYDAEGSARKLQERFSIAYPDELKKSIIEKNYPLLIDSMPAYFHQVKKACERQDRISIHHRVTEFLASYFDILFAINSLAHPGEKRLIEFAQSNCKILPKDFNSDMLSLLEAAGAGKSDSADIILKLSRELKKLF